MKPVNEEKNSKIILRVLWGFTIAFAIGALCAGNLSQLIPGFVKINTQAAQFTMDYFKLGGLGGAFLNTAAVALVCCLIFTLSGAVCTGLSVAAFWLNVGFATFGMTVTGMLPFVLGVFVYSRVKKVSFGSVANQSLFATALAPFAAELLFRYPNAEVLEGAAVTASRSLTIHGLLGALVLGVCVGMITPPICAHAPNFHKGYDLYSAGPAMGFIAFLVYCVLYRSPGIPQPVNTDLGIGERMYVNIFFLIVFGLLLLYAYVLDHDCFRQYRELWKSDGYKTDYTAKFGMPATLVNMGVYGLFILLYYNVVHGFVVTDGNLVFTGAKFTGATMGAIMCMYAFCCQGAQPRTVFPIAVGYCIASLLPLFAYLGGVTETLNWGMTTQAILVGMCFASGLAPVSGKYGFWGGVIAGALHATMVMSVPLTHGGFCLYNGGFTAGIVCFLLIPVFECFWKTKEERKK